MNDLVKHVLIGLSRLFAIAGFFAGRFLAESPRSSINCA